MTRNAINNTRAKLTIDPGGSGDSYTQFDINATGEFRIGVDDTASDAFKVSQGSALGANDTFIMTASGERTLPIQPAFLVDQTGTVSSVTGDGTSYAQVFNVEIFDVGGDFASATVTAPVTGRYQFGFAERISGLTSSHTQCEMRIITSNRSYRVAYYNIWALSAGATVQWPDCAILADMDASDTATFNIIVTGGTKVVDISGSTFSRVKAYGFLVC